MWAHGLKGASGSITVRAGSYTYIDKSTNTGYYINVSSQTYAASWDSTGAGSTGGYAGCGS